MCGIAGVIFKDNLKDYVDVVTKMTSIIRHRGPDDNGVSAQRHCVLGHTRLSIIDTSAAGHQPMRYMDRYTITYNGEIYNYLELREELGKEGYVFSTHSDTEVILAAFDQWKEKCVDRFNGMFAFGIYDAVEDSLFLARDRAGVKPLYYYQNDNELYFCSEPKQLVFSNILAAKPNYGAISQYLAFQFSLGNSTFFESIYKLEPGSYATYKNNELKLAKYWDIDNIAANNNITEDDAKKKIRELLTDAVRLRLRSDVKVASYLSGGVDSSIISSVAAKLLTHIDTYTFTSKKHPRFDESVDAGLMANFIGSNHHEVELELSDILELWKKAVYHMDEPEVGYSLLPQMRISEEVAKDIKVILSGQGGDELFFGYGWYNQLIMDNFNDIKEISFTDKLKIVFSIATSGNYRFLFNIFKAKGTLANNYFRIWKDYGCYDLIDPDGLREELISKLGTSPSLINIKKMEYKYWLRGLLHVEDRSSMAYGLESRVPLMDYRLAEFVFSLPPAYMINGTINKKIFIDSFRGIIHDRIASKKEKQGYASPINNWLKEKKVRDFIDKILGDDKSFIYEFVLKKVAFGDLNPRQIWLLVSLELWHKIFIIREMQVYE